MSMNQSTEDRMETDIQGTCAALRMAVVEHDAATSDVQDAEAALSAARQTQRYRLKMIGGAVRSLRVALGHSAEDMSRKAFSGRCAAEHVAKYVAFEDTGDLEQYTRRDLLIRLLEEADGLSA